MSRHLVHTAVALLVIAGLAVPARAGIHYKATTKVAGQQGQRETAVDGWVDGDRAKVVIEKSGNPVMEEGSYLLTADGGKTLYLVNPEEKTYGELDLGALMGTMGTMMNAMGPLLKVNVTNHKVEKLAEEPGPAMFGHATTHYRFHTAYDMSIRVLMMNRASHVDTTTDAWTTGDFADLGLRAWLRSEPPRSGNPDIDRLIAGAFDKDIRGVPLKLVTASKNTDAKGTTSESTVTMEVSSLEQQAVPAATFDMPKGYEKVEVMPAMPAQQ
jgi:uncharacterized protein DUF4412